MSRRARLSSIKAKIVAKDDGRWRTAVDWSRKIGRPKEDVAEALRSLARRGVYASEFLHGVPIYKRKRQ